MSHRSLDIEDQTGQYYRSFLLLLDWHFQACKNSTFFLAFTVTNVALARHPPTPSQCIPVPIQTPLNNPHPPGPKQQCPDHSQQLHINQRMWLVNVPITHQDNTAWTHATLNTKWHSIFHLTKTKGVTVLVSCGSTLPKDHHYWVIPFH